jgi:propanediol utilization protein
MTNIKIPVEISARHLHLSKKDFEKLFGKEENLKSIKKLSQLGEFASNKLVTLLNGSKKIENVRILGPFREKSQVEISATDAYTLGLKPLPKIKISGDLKNTTKISILGKKGKINLPCIISKRHIHVSEEQAKKLSIKNNQRLAVKIQGEREITFNNIIARVSKNYNLALHLDTDEGNSAGIFKKTFGELIR